MVKDRENTTISTIELIGCVLSYAITTRSTVRVVEVQTLGIESTGMDHIADVLGDIYYNLFKKAQHINHCLKQQLAQYDPTF